MLLCKFCDRECKNSNSHKNHERQCPKNLNRTYVNGMLGKKGANQYSKAKRLGLPKPIMSEEQRLKLSLYNKARTPEWNKENGKRVSSTVRKKVEEGTWHTSLAKHMHIDYNGIDLHGTWEVKYAQYLDANSIKWIRNKDSFTYSFEEKERRYTPDFYLLDSDEYIEIKGYKTDKDIAKWSQFPKHRKLVVLMEKELKDLNIL